MCGMKGVEFYALEQPPIVGGRVAPRWEEAKPLAREPNGPYP